jgi:hypothetical protein
MITFLAPLSAWTLAFSASVNRPVDSMTHVRAEVAPRQLGRVALGERLEALAGDGDLVGGRLHLVRQPAQNRVVLEQVGQGRVVGEVVRPDELDVGARGEHRPEEVAADTAKAIDTHTDSHRSALPHVCAPASFGRRPINPQGRAQPEFHTRMCGRHWR